MVIDIKVQDLEDEIINPLNNILLLSYGKDVFKEIEKEIKRIVEVLEKNQLINKRR